MSDDENDVKSGVAVGSPAPLFENLDEEERAVEDSNPFKAPRRIGGGSRKGVPNRRTEDFRRYYASLGFTDPLLFLGHVISLKTGDLARELQCKAGEALEVQRKAASDLAPYLHSKQPAKLDVGGGEALPVLVVRELDSAASIRAGRAAGSLAIDDDLAERLGRDEQYQGLAAGEARGSHGQGSHEAAKGETDHDVDGV